MKWINKNTHIQYLMVIVLFVSCAVTTTHAETKAEKKVLKPDSIIQYKAAKRGRFDDKLLKLHIFNPQGFSSADSRPAVLFFHGGGWESGNATWGYPESKRYAQIHGFVGISVEYRLSQSIPKPTPIDCLSDARSAVKWVRQHADELGIDPKRIIASGFSAGGHLSVSLGVIPDLETDEGNNKFSSVPNAIIVQAAPVNLETDSFFKQILRGQAEPADYSPSHFIRPGLPPILMTHGNIDATVPVTTVLKFAEKMTLVGNTCKLKVYPGCYHLFRYNGCDKHYTDVNLRIKAFLQELGYLKKV